MNLRSDPWEPPIIFMAEARVFTEHTDNIDNNFMIWGGLRFFR